VVEAAVPQNPVAVRWQPMAAERFRGQLIQKDA
jgi:hypothetical protein